MRDTVLVIQHSGAYLIVAAVDSIGHVRAMETRLFGIDRTNDGQVEADAHEVWQVAREGMGAVLQEVGREAVGAVAVVTEPGTALLWEQEHSRPVTPVLMTDDRRADAVCRSFRERGWDDAFRRRTGHLPTPSAAGFKVSELLAALPRGYSRAADGELLFGSLASFFLLRLTGSRVHATSRANALHSLLYNIEQDAWDIELLQVFNVPRACLPDVHPSAHIYGETTLGGRLPAAVPIAAMGTLLESALYGGVGARPGATYVQLDEPVGLVSYVGPERRPPPLPLGETLAVDADPDLRFTLFALASTTPARWCVRLGLVDEEADALVLAARAEDSGGIVFVPDSADTNGSEESAAHFYGAGEDAEPARLARAVFERSVYQARSFLADLAAQQEPEPLAVAGAFTALPGLGQRLADLTGRTVALLPDGPYAVLGAARLAVRTAALGGEIGRGIEDPACVRLTPRLAPDERAAQLDAWRTAVSA